MNFIILTEIGEEDPGAPRSASGRTICINTDHVRMVIPGSERQVPGAPNATSSRIVVAGAPKDLEFVVRESPEEVRAKLTGKLMLKST